MCITEIGRISLCRGDALLKFENLVHGFTTRKGGVSTGEYSSMSLSPFRGDDISSVHKNEEILCAELGLSAEKLTSTRQEHTDNIEIIDEDRIGIGVAYDWEKGVDGVITTLKNVPLICYSADCVPILLYADDIEAIGAVHAGWCGTEAQIIKKCIGKLVGMGAAPQNIYCAIGPHIGQCCYEVSEDVRVRFDDKYSDDKGKGKYMLSLGRVNHDLIKGCGVPEENISVSSMCTKCNNSLFFSHRGQNGKSGTLGGIICMKKPV